jgi:hypothetical protein
VLYNPRLKYIMPVLLTALSAASQAQAEFVLNFQPSASGNVVSSIANQSCSGGNGGGMMGGMGGMGGMMGFSDCGVDYFHQEVVNSGGAQFYHVILGRPADGFAIEYYMRTGGCCWFSGGGMMGGMGMMGGGGDAPYSSSYGDLNDRLFNFYDPLSNNPAAGSATGNPNRVYMRMVNNDATMNQEFIKAKEGNKPRIIQTVKNGTAMTSSFDLDMSNGGYNAYSNPASFTNKTSVTGVGAFDAASAPQARINAGRFRYTPGNSFSGAYGSYNYESGGINMVGVNWLSYCDPDQNPDYHCDYTSGGGGGGMMGGMGGGGMGGGM